VVAGSVLRTVRCILCYRCVRVCGEGMDVWALGVQNRGVGSIIAPNKEDHLECENAACASTSAPSARSPPAPIVTRRAPWEMKHVGTICTHCRRWLQDNAGRAALRHRQQIVARDNVTRAASTTISSASKGRYAFDFADHAERLTQPSSERMAPEAATWEEAFSIIEGASQNPETKKAARTIGVVGSTAQTNEENYLLSKSLASS